MSIDIYFFDDLNFDEWDKTPEFDTKKNVEKSKKIEKTYKKEKSVEIDVETELFGFMMALLVNTIFFTPLIIYMMWYIKN